MAAPKSVLTSQADDFPRWYQDVVAKAELADNGPVRGTMVIRPYGYAIWEQIQGALDRRIKAAGAENAYFPLFIPEEYLRREAEHVEGFSPELAVVTHGGGKELEEPVVVRPTSETIINSFFAKWVQSYRDLPLLVNQWANVVRWELRPRLFLRTTEFLWQEGHTCHVTESDAHEYALRILRDVYSATMVEHMSIPVHAGRKTDKERFAGATTSWTTEGVMADGKALQMSTSHELGQNFSKVFGTEFSTETGGRDFAWQTSWGASTRLMGALIMSHGDDAGLRLPPRIAPTQVVVMVVRDEGEVMTAASGIVDQLRAWTSVEDGPVRVKLDDRVDVSFGRRATDWELKGVPIRIEVGPRDLANREVTIVRRDTREKETVGFDGLDRRAGDLLGEIQANLLSSAEARRASLTVDVATVDEAEEAARTGLARIPWAAVGLDGERALAGKGVTVRCLQREDGSLPSPGEEEGLVAYVGRAY